MSYDMYLAQKLIELHAARREKSLELARVLAEARPRRGVAERLLERAGEALIVLGRKLKERSEPTADLTPKWYW